MTDSLPDVQSENKPDNTIETETSSVLPAASVELADPKKIKKFKKTVTVSRTYSSTFSNEWLFPESALKNVWYIAVYLGDKIPYVIKFDGHYWRDRHSKIIAIPMRIKSVGELPKERKDKED